VGKITTDNAGVEVRAVWLHRHALFMWNLLPIDTINEFEFNTQCAQMARYRRTALMKSCKAYDEYGNH